MINSLSSLYVYPIFSIRRRLTAYLQLCVLVAVGAVCAGCVTVSFDEYETVVLDESFEAEATRVDVKAPVKRYEDTFYNISMGEYQVNGTSIGKNRTVRADRKDGPERTIIEDDSFWNLVLKGELTFEKVEYDQYRIEDKSQFSFRVTDQVGREVESRCERNSVALENKEVSRVAVGLGEISDEQVVQRYEQWLASKLSCAINDGDQEWTLIVTTAHQKRPTVELQSAGGNLRSQVLEYSIANAPAVGGRVPSGDDEFLTLGNRFAGVSISNGSNQLAAVSMARGNSVIWLGSATTIEERLMLLAGGYSLILNDWLVNN